MLGGRSGGAHTIFIYDRGCAGYTGSGIVLEAGQQLLGDGSTLTSVNGNTSGVSASNADMAGAPPACDA